LTIAIDALGVLDACDVSGAFVVAAAPSRSCQAELIDGDDAGGGAAQPNPSRSTVSPIRFNDPRFRFLVMARALSIGDGRLSIPADALVCSPIRL